MGRPNLMHIARLVLREKCCFYNQSFYSYFDWLLDLTKWKGLGTVCIHQLLHRYLMHQIHSEELPLVTCELSQLHMNLQVSIKLLHGT